MQNEQIIDKLLSAFAYVREIGRGEYNHIGLELTVSFGDRPLPDDKAHRAAVKQFLLDAMSRSELGKWHKELQRIAKEKGFAWLVVCTPETYQDSFNEGLTPEEHLSEEIEAAKVDC